MSRVLAALVVVAVLAGAAGVWVVRTEPDVYLRARYPLRYESIIRTHARNYDLDPTLLAAVVYTESRFNASARSSAGAVGLMQLLPDTAKGIAVRTGGDGFVVSDLLDPEINVRYGSWYLRSLLRPVRRPPHGARGVPRRSGERRPLARRGGRDPVPRDAQLRRRGARGAGALRARLSRRARRLSATSPSRARVASVPPCATRACRRTQS